MSAVPTLFVDGAPATQADLAWHALVNYGALTSFRVEAGGARGLDLHLARLEASALELFGEGVGEGRLRELMRAAVAGRAACWLRISLFSSGISTRDPTWRGSPKVMIGVFDPPPPLAHAIRLQTQAYERDTPHLKHVATTGLLLARRRARAAGFDDALFLDRQGRVSEGSLWNIGFLTDETIVWPQAPMLVGVTQAVLQDGLAAAGFDSRTEPVTPADFDRLDAAFICNSATPACAVMAIDDRAFPERPDLIARLRAIWDAAPLQPI